MARYFVWYSGRGQKTIPGVGTFNFRTPPQEVNQQVFQDLSQEQAAGWRTHAGSRVKVSVLAESFEGTVVNGGEYIPRCKAGDTIEVLDRTAADLQTLFSDSFEPFEKINQDSTSSSDSNYSSLRSSNKVACYDAAYGSIGQVIKGVAYVKQEAKKYSDAKISLLDDKEFDVAKWMDFKPFKTYASKKDVPADVVILNADSFDLNAEISNLAKESIYPEMRLPRSVTNRCRSKYARITREPFVTAMIHDLDFDKYRNLMHSLVRQGYKVVRIGREPLSVQEITGPGVYDMTQDNLPLEETLYLIARSKLYIGGNATIKFAASALGVPLVLETDGNDMEGIKPNLLTALRLPTGLDTIFRECMKRLNEGG